MLRLTTKDDLESVVTRWEHFWNGELYQRPVVATSVPRQGIAPRDVVSVHGR